MTKAIRLYEHGGPEVLRWEDVDLPDPGPHEIKLRHTAIGLNFIDVYQRTGLYPIPLPHSLGSEAAGVVEAVGTQVRGLKPGDRVAYAGGAAREAYSEARIIAATDLVPIPDGISDIQAAGMMLKGMTAWYLLNKSYAVQPGDTILFYAAAGGVGLIAVQWAKHLGATVIGTVSSDEKAALARRYGCEHIIVSTRDDVPGAVDRITKGAKLPVVYDSIGRDSFFDSLDCLRPHGVMVSFGNASGSVDPFSLLELSKRGSLFVTRPTLFHFIEERASLLEAAGALFDLVLGGAIRIEINQRYALQDAARAHRDLEARKTTGSTVMLP